MVVRGANGSISTVSSGECLDKLGRLLSDFLARLAQSEWDELRGLLVHICRLLEIIGLHAGFFDRPAVLVPSEQQAELLVVAPKELEKAAQLVVDLAALPGWLEQLCCLRHLSPERHLRLARLLTERIHRWPARENIRVGCSNNISQRLCVPLVVGVHCGVEIGAQQQHFLGVGEILQMLGRAMFRQARL